MSVSPSLSPSQLGGILVEGIETSLLASGQLDYEGAPTHDKNENSSSTNQITLSAEAMDLGSSRQPALATSSQSVPTPTNQVGGVSGGVASQEVKKDVAGVWSNREVESPMATPSLTSHISTNTSSQPPESHSQTDAMELDSDPKPQPPVENCGSSPPHPTPTPATDPPSLPTDNNPLVTTTTSDHVAMETEEAPESQTNQQSVSAQSVPTTTEQTSMPWFSLTPRSPCETKPAVTMATAALQNGTTEPQYQLMTTAGGQQLLTQATPSGVMQYYITSSGAIAAAAPTQQLQMGYALVGNTLVPQQYLTAAPQQQFIVSQGGVQYLVGGGTSGLLGLGGVAVVPQTGGVAVGEGGAVLQTLGDGGGPVVLGGGGGVMVGGGGGGVLLGDQTALASAGGSVAAKSVGGVREGAEVTTNHIPSNDVTDDKQQEPVAKETREVMETKPISPVISKGQNFNE